MSEHSADTRSLVRFRSDVGSVSANARVLIVSKNAVSVEPSLCVCVYVLASEMFALVV